MNSRSKSYNKGDTYDKGNAQEEKYCTKIALECAVDDPRDE